VFAYRNKYSQRITCFLVLLVKIGIDNNKSYVDKLIASEK